MTEALDDIDKKIIKEYINDSRLSYREIAKRIKVAVGTVMARTQKLQDSGIIKGYSAIIDHEKIGYPITALIEIVVSKGKLLEMEKEIANLDGPCIVYDITGNTDALIIGKFRSRDELSTFTKHILSMPFVDRTNTHLVLATVKEDLRIYP